VTTVSAAFYRTIYNTKFNLGFGSPRSDTCATCDKQNGDFSEHREKANTAFTVQQKDQLSAESDADVHYITFDLQKNSSIAQTFDQYCFIFI